MNLFYKESKSKKKIFFLSFFLSFLRGGGEGVGVERGGSVSEFFLCGGGG